jgi:hypothetical protein
MINSEELVGTTEHLTLYAWCRIYVVVTGFDCDIILVRVQLRLILCAIPDSLNL